jgi:phosphate transport system substrate-binding protein
VPRVLIYFQLILSILLACPALAGAADGPPSAPMKIQCVAALKNLLAEAAPKLIDDGIKVKPIAGGGSADAFAALGSATADMVLTLRPISGEERAAYPEKIFQEFEIGKQTVALIIPEILWNNGIKALTREQVAGIYERQFTNWNELGGPNRSIKFFNPAIGQGVWEMFASWVYGDAAKAAAGHFESVEDSENAAAAVQFNSGGLSVAYLRWANQKDVFALPIKDDTGSLIEPSLENIASGKYPLTRSIYLAVAGKPLGNRRRVIDFFTGGGIREILLHNDIIPTADLALRSRGSTK